MNDSPELAAARAAAAEADAGLGAVPGAKPDNLSGGAEAEAAAGKRAGLVAENLALLDMAVALLEPVLPFIRQCYTPEACRKIAEAGADVEEKYGVTLGDLFTKWKPEIMLAVAVVPPTLAAVRLTRELIASKRAAAPPEPPKGGASVVPIRKEGGGGGETSGGS